MSLAYVSPPVAVGQVVLWSYGPNERPSPAIVTAVGQGGSINCLCHVDNIKDHVLRTGVRHRGDPFVVGRPSHDSGVWDLTERDRKLDLILADLGRLLADAHAHLDRKVVAGGA